MPQFFHCSTWRHMWVLFCPTPVCMDDTKPLIMSGRSDCEAHVGGDWLLQWPHSEPSSSLSPLLFLRVIKDAAHFVFHVHLWCLPSVAALLIIPGPRRSNDMVYGLLHLVYGAFGRQCNLWPFWTDKYVLSLGGHVCLEIIDFQHVVICSLFLLRVYFNERNLHTIYIYLRLWPTWKMRNVISLRSLQLHILNKGHFTVTWLCLNLTIRPNLEVGGFWSRIVWNTFA